MKTRVRVIIGVLLLVFVVINIVLIVTQREAEAPQATTATPAAAIEPAP